MGDLRELLSLINNHKFEEALLYYRKFQQDSDVHHLEHLRELAVGAIFDAVTKFRENNDDVLRSLVVSLLDAIHPETLKFRICFNFITERITPHLTEILISQLGFVVMNNFRKKHPHEWQELCEFLPPKLEKILPDECSTDMVDAALDVAHILYSFHEIPFVIPERMSSIFTAAVNTTQPELPRAFPLLLFHLRTHPFSPKLIGVEKPTVLIPSVYSLYYQGRKLAEGLTMYLRENDYNYEKHFVKPIVIALDVIVHALQELDESDILLCSDLIVRLLHFVEDFEQYLFRVPILNRCMEIVNRFPSWPKCLLIKRLVSQVLDSSDLCLDNESSVVALFIDEYRRHLIEESFQKELGSFFGLLEDVRYENMCEASNYYMSIFTLVQFVAIRRFNPPMLREVKIRVLERVYNQLTDYIQLEEIREKARKNEETMEVRLPECPVEVKAPFEGPMIEQIQLLLFSLDQAKQYILHVLS